MKIYKLSAQTPTWEEINKQGPKSKQYSNEPFDGNYERVNRDFMDEYKKRVDFTQNVSWAVPTKEAIQKIKNFVSGRKVLEVGSGFGLWAKLLKDVGVNVIPTDNFSGYGSEVVKQNKDKLYTEVENIEAEEALKKHHDSTALIMIWPPYECLMAANILKGFNGDRFIYIGESSGGCNATDEFFDILNENWKFVDNFEIPQWDGIYDEMSMYQRQN